MGSKYSGIVRCDCCGQVIQTKKACTCCLIAKPLDAFTLDSSGRLGRRGMCKECQSIRDKSDPKKKKYRREWHEKHPGYSAAKTMAKYCKNLNRMPAWSSVDSTLPFYAKAAALTKETGKAHSVDHIIPLNGENISGLHVAENLQVMLLSDNIRKGNSYD